MRRVSGWCVLLVAALAGSAIAAGDRDPEALAVDAMEHGLKLRAVGDPEAALAEFRRAITLVPQANRPHKFAAETLEDLQRYSEAIASYEEYLRLKPNVRDAEATRARIEDIRSRHLEGTLEVECAPVGAKVFLDGKDEPVGVTPLRNARVVAGEHQVAIRAAGFLDEKRTVRVSPGAQTLLGCELKPEHPEPPPAPPPTVVTPPPSPPRVESPPLVVVKPPPPTPIYRRWWLWSAVGVVVAAVAVGLGLAYGLPSLPQTSGGVFTFPATR
jgi:hypothetical protein